MTTKYRPAGVTEEPESGKTKLHYLNTPFGKNAEMEIENADEQSEQDDANLRRQQQAKRTREA